MIQDFTDKLLAKSKIVRKDYDFAPVGPFCIKEIAEKTAELFGGKVIPMNSIYGGIGYYVVPLNMNESFEVIGR